MSGALQLVENLDPQIVLFSIGIGAIGLALLLYSLCSKQKNVPEKEVSKEQPTNTSTKKPKDTESSNKRKQAKSAKVVDEGPKRDCVIIKSHTKTVNGACFTKDSKYLVSVSDDRTLRIISAPFTAASASSNTIRVNLPLDAGSALCLSADSRHAIVALSNSRDIIAYRFSSKKDEDGKLYKEVYRFPTNLQSIKSLAIAANSKFILTATEETDVVLWSLKGNKLDTINTNQMKTNMACISPNSKFISVAAWTGDVRIWEVQYAKDTQEYSKVTKAMELKGHKSAVHCVNFSSDSTRVASVSKDGTWRLWRIDVRYHIGEDPQCLLTVETPDKKEVLDMIAISPDMKTVAITTKSNTLYFYTIDGKLIDTVKRIHEGPIASLSWAEDSKTLLTAGDVSLKIWNNPQFAQQK